MSLLKYLRRQKMESQCLPQVVANDHQVITNEPQVVANGPQVVTNSPQVVAIDHQKSNNDYELVPINNMKSQNIVETRQLYSPTKPGDIPYVKSTMSLDVPGGGVTLIPPSSTPEVPRNRSRTWFWTWFNYPEDFVSKMSGFLGQATAYAYNQEICPDKGTPHIQGCVKFKHQVEFNTVRSYIEGAHWEKVHKWEDAVKYCIKTESRKPGTEPVTKGTPKPVKDPLAGKTLKYWQKDIFDIINTEPEDRKAYWFWSKCSGKGKSYTVKHICMMYKACMVGGTHDNIMCAIANYCEKTEIWPEIIIWDLEMIVGNNISYRSIEGVMKGHIFSGKYKSGDCIFNTPHVFIFANQPPRIRPNEIAKDKIKVIEIDPEDDWPIENPPKNHN